MNQICVQPEFLLALLTEVGRHRTLADHETDIIEAIVCRGHRSAAIRIRWTRRLDQKLITAAKARGGIRQFARTNNIPPQAAYDRLHKLRKRAPHAGTPEISAQGRAQGQNGVKGYPRSQTAEDALQDLSEPRKAKATR